MVRDDPNFEKQISSVTALPRYAAACFWMTYPDCSSAASTAIAK
jgi:hypothetical protein